MGGRFRAGLSAFALSAGVAMVMALAVVTAPAVADSTVCSAGSGAGQCSDPDGVATDLETGQVYVADSGNNRIDVFKADGEFLFAFGWNVNKGSPEEKLQTCTTLTGCQKGSEGGGDGQFKAPRRVAVDNAPASPSLHAVYVFDSGNRRIQKFTPSGEFLKKREGIGTGPGQFQDQGDLIAVGPGGNVYVADMPEFENHPRIEKFDPALSFLGECEIPHKDRFEFNESSLALDSAGNIYSTFNGGGGIFKFSYAEPICVQAGAPYPLEPKIESGGLAVDGADNLYSDQRVPRAKGGIVRAVAKYSAGGTLVRRYGFGSLNVGTRGIAAQPTAPVGVVVSEETVAVKSLVEPPPGPVVGALETSQPVGNVRTTLEAEIDPEGKASSYHFEYVTQKGYEEQGNSFTGPSTKTTPVVGLGGAADFELHLASVAIGCTEASVEAINEEKCLRPATVYRYQVLAANADGGGNSPVERTFTFETAPAVRIEDTFVSEVGVDAARFTAKVNPLGIAGTTGYFEYVEEAKFKVSGFGEARKVPDLDAGASPLGYGGGEVGVSKSISLQLAPNTIYHLRAAATDPLLEGAAVFGKEVVFTTFKSEGEGTEPPCAQNEAFRAGFSALLPDCRAYELVSPLDKGGADIVIGTDETEYPNGLAQSSISGAKLAYPTNRAFGDAKAAPLVAQYIAERSAAGWQSHYILGPRGRLNELAVRSGRSELRALSPDLCEAWIKAYAEPPLAAGAIPEQLNLYRRTDQAADCGGEEKWEALSTVAPPHGSFALGRQNFEIQGISADGTKAIYIAEDNLTPDAPDLGGKGVGLYYQEAGEGAPRFVCRLPSGAPVTGTCTAGTTGDITIEFGGPGRLSNLTGAMSGDGQRVFWTKPFPGPVGVGEIFMRENPGEEQSAVLAGVCTEAGKACTIAVSAKGEELSKTKASRFWAASPDGSKVLYSSGSDLYLYDVESGSTTLIAGKALGVMGASSDLGRIYLGSEEVLSGANAEGKAPTGGKANVYFYEGGSFHFVATVATLDRQVLNPLPVRHSARVTPDGMHATFMSSVSLTGYDNTDAKSGEADAEVFLYDASAEAGKGKLVCVSCNPSGGRPAGQKLLNGHGLEKFWVAGRQPIMRSSLYASHFLADGGQRLFFEAFDALSPRDTNGAADVYQWEAAGTGSCGESSSSYSVQNQGCVSLISSGQGSGDAEMLDASPSGDDVFFTTAQGLLRQDYGLTDAYDARVGGGLPELLTEPSICEGESCQHPAPAPELQPPASLNYEGPGDLEEGKAKPKCPKGKVRKHGHCVKKQAKHGKQKKGAKANSARRSRS